MSQSGGARDVTLELYTHIPDKGCFSIRVRQLAHFGHPYNPQHSEVEQKSVQDTAHAVRQVFYLQPEIPPTTYLRSNLFRRTTTETFDLVMNNAFTSVTIAGPREHMDDVTRMFKESIRDIARQAWLANSSKSYQ